MTGPILLLCLASFLLSWAATFSLRRLAPKFGFVDKPGGRKIHANPKPLGGGIALFLAVALPLAAILIAAWIPATPSAVGAKWAPYVGGVKQQTSLGAGILLAMLAMHALGLSDDRKAMGPYSKLIIQLSIIAAVVAVFPHLRILTALGPWPSGIVTVLWIGVVTNAFNFLDNMDGLSAGVAAVCTVAFLIAAATLGQWFVAAMLALLLGALLGFLCFNFAPASIFMGDSGSLLIGFILGVLTTLTTYLPHGKDLAAGWYAVFAPVIVLAVPLYDLLVVSALRLSRGKSPFVGDTNHFSHRLVARGMSRRTAVLCLYLITAATAVAATLLPHVRSTIAALLIFVQTLLILSVVMLLEQHPLPTPPTSDKP